MLWPRSRPFGAVPALCCALGAAALIAGGCERTIQPGPSERRATPPSAIGRRAGGDPSDLPSDGAPAPATASAAGRTTSPGAPGLDAPNSLGNQTIESFTKAKRLAAELYADHRLTLYCGCRFDERLAVEPASCGYQPLVDGPRARRVEWEHVVPAEAFGRSFVEWREGHPDCVDRRGRAFRGRECARKVSREFRRMEADLYNLYPAIGELNGLRANFGVAEIDGEAREHGACDVEIEGTKFEPRAEVKGDVARTYLYMDQAYPGRGIVSGKNRKLLEAWSALDPPDDWECERARRIAAVQRSDHPALGMACRPGR